MSLGADAGIVDSAEQQDSSTGDASTSRAPPRCRRVQTRLEGARARSGLTLERYGCVHWRDCCGVCGGFDLFQDVCDRFDQVLKTLLQLCLAQIRDKAIGVAAW